MFFSDCFWETGQYFPTFFEFLTEFSQQFCCDFLLLNPPSMLATFPFYSVILVFKVPLIPPLWLPGYQSPYYASHSDSWFFLCFSYFSSFSPVFLKATCWLFFSGCSWRANLHPLFFQGFLPFRLNFLNLLLAVIFSKWAESIHAGLKVFPTASLYSSSFWVSWGTSLLFMNCHPPSFLVLCCTTRCLRRTYFFFVSCISWYPFWAVSIPL